MDEESFDDERLGRSAAELFDELLRLRPPREENVVAQGDATFANLLAQNGQFSGFIDCARLGLADRHQDLALIVRDIRHVMGEEWIEPLLRHYGRDADPERLAFYNCWTSSFEAAPCWRRCRTDSRSNSPRGPDLSVRSAANGRGFEREARAIGWRAASRKAKTGGQGGIRTPVGRSPAGSGGYAGTGPCGNRSGGIVGGAASLVQPKCASGQWPRIPGTIS
ncbi:phosphotransferase [Bosea sp. F3-2]|uniref:phosphotransferase n=1 Tax=Bosea sp. F3-2 TaxID=2599640 RepID=UPI0020BD89AF|nr:phosphotransferase [Bosea sp. F3-2]